MKIAKPKIDKELTIQKEFYQALEENYMYHTQFENELFSFIEEEHIHFDSCRFKNVIFEECKFSHIDMMDCIFEGCDLSNIIMSEGCMHRCEFHNCRMVGADFSSMVIKNITFDTNNNRYGNFSCSKMQNCLFQNMDMTSSNLNDMKLKDIVFDKCNLNSCEFIHTPLTNIDVSSCTIDGITITEDSMKGMCVSPAQALELSKLLGLRIKE